MKCSLWGCISATILLCVPIGSAGKCSLCACRCTYSVFCVPVGALFLLQSVVCLRAADTKKCPLSARKCSLDSLRLEKSTLDSLRKKSVLFLLESVFCVPVGVRSMSYMPIRNTLATH